MSSQNSGEMYLYHYTSEEGLRSIYNQRVVFVSDEQRIDANYRYGPGVYLTRMSPDNGHLKILRNNRDGATLNPDFIRKTVCYVKINKKDLPFVQKVKLQRTKRNVWRNLNNIDLQKTAFFYGYTEEGSAEEKFCPVPFSVHAQRSQPQMRTRTGVQSGISNTLEISNFVTTLSTYDDDEDETSVIVRKPTLTQPESRLHNTPTFSTQQQTRDSGFSNRFCTALENFFSIIFKLLVFAWVVSFFSLEMARIVLVLVGIAVGAFFAIILSAVILIIIAISFAVDLSSYLYCVWFPVIWENIQFDKFYMKICKSSH